jgi:hypothetical protein
MAVASCDRHCFFCGRVAVAVMRTIGLAALAMMN